MSNAHVLTRAGGIADEVRAADERNLVRNEVSRQPKILARDQSQISHWDEAVRAGLTDRLGSSSARRWPTGCGTISASRPPLSSDRRDVPAGDGVRGRHSRGGRGAEARRPGSRPDCRRPEVYMAKRLPRGETGSRSSPIPCAPRRRSTCPISA
ncbi:MAG: hypothetical protein HPM95_10850 [Alphaproteobacteria bacterium]|nr:hypothetical protein [Alphaproteobacteria bacterium]